MASLAEPDQAGPAIVGRVLIDREWATLIWLLAALVFVLGKPDLRRSYRGVVAAFVRPPALALLLLYTAWIAGVVWLASELGPWQVDQVTNTIVWAIPGFGLVLASTEVPWEAHLFRRRFWQTVSVAAGLWIYLNIDTLGLWPEVVVQGVLAVATSVAVHAAHTKEKAAERLAYLVIGVILLLLLLPPTVDLFSNPASFSATALIRELALPIWLTLGALPLVFGLSLWLAYSEAFRLMKAASGRGQVSWRAKLVLLVSFHVRLGAMREFARDWPRVLLRTKGFRRKRRILADQQADLRAAAAARRQRVDDLARYAGVSGTDAEGRQLDRREFQETSDAMTWLSTIQMARYHTDGRYDRHALDGFPSLLEGLPEDHGITIRVSRSGESWLAWRRTVTGWCFAIGSAGPPMDQWYYDGPEPPNGYPGQDPAWGDEPFAHSPNWMGSEERRVIDARPRPPGASQ